VSLEIWSFDDHNPGMSTHSVAEAKTHLSGLIDRALQGEEVVITRHGRPVVALRPVGDAPARMSNAESLAWLRANRVTGGGVDPEDAASLVGRLRDDEQRR
jgi:prevent-host-death family protein